MLRVLLVSPTPPPAGGIGTWTLRVVHSTLDRRVEMRIVPDKAERSRQSQQGVTWDNVEVAGRLFAKVLRHGLTWRPDVVHISSPARFPGSLRDLLLADAARRLGAATVLTMHGSQMEGLEGSGPVPTLARRLIRKVDRVLVLNRSMVELMERVGARATQVPNPVDLRPAPDRADHAGPVRFLFVGWMLRTKGVFELLRAMEDVPGAHLTLLGRVLTSEDDAELQRRVAALGDRVSMPGEVSMEEVWRHYDAADVLVLPSHTEGLPNVLLESMMAGLPAIVTPVGAMAEVVEDGRSGLVVPVEDVPALAAAMRRLVEDGVLRREMGARARELCLATFETEAVMRRIEQVYDEVTTAR